MSIQITRVLSFGEYVNMQEEAVRQAWVGPPILEARWGSRRPY